MEEVDIVLLGDGEPDLIREDITVLKASIKDEKVVAGVGTEDGTEAETEQ